MKKKFCERLLLTNKKLFPLEIKKRNLQVRSERKGVKENES